MEPWIIAAVSSVAIGSTVPFIIRYINRKKEKKLREKIYKEKEWIKSYYDTLNFSDAYDPSLKKYYEMEILEYIIHKYPSLSRKALSSIFVHKNTAQKKAYEVVKKNIYISKLINDVLRFRKDNKTNTDTSVKQDKSSSCLCDVKTERKELDSKYYDFTEFSSLLDNYINNRYKDIRNVIYNIKHLLGTPLSGIKANLAIMSKNGDSEFSAEMNPRLESISNAVEMIESSINTLLEYDNSDDSGSIKRIISQCAKVVTLSSTKKINIQTDLIPEELSFTKTITDALVLCVQCIIENAAVYSPDNGKIAVEYKKEGKIHELHISNYGEPIPVEIGNHIFEKHFTTREEGTGIGLYLAKRTAIDILHGDIRYENIIGDDGHDKVVFILSFEV